MDAVDALGWAGSVLLVWSVLQTRVLRFRVLNLVASVVLTTFNAVLGIWSMVAMNGVLAVINAWYLVGLVRGRHDAETYDVVQVGVADAWLARVLTVHQDDVARFQPGFVRPGLYRLADAGRSAYLVVRGDETVGVVVLRAEAGEAHVELDWVVPRYRDFSPGEFVWRRSGLLDELGVRRLVTPPGMVGAYYHRLGFRREGDSYVLERA